MEGLKAFYFHWFQFHSHYLALVLFYLLVLFLTISFTVSHKSNGILNRRPQNGSSGVKLDLQIVGLCCSYIVSFIIFTFWKITFYLENLNQEQLYMLYPDSPVFTHFASFRYHSASSLSLSTHTQIHIQLFCAHFHTFFKRLFGSRLHISFPFPP